MNELSDLFYKELNSILSFWSTVAFDRQQQRFYGKIDNQNGVDRQAPLGAVLYARILWAFSAGYQVTGNILHKEMAGYAYTNLINLFRDKEYGGIYWTVDAAGRPLDTKKQIYALAFAIYGLSEYYKICRNEQVLDVARELFDVIEKCSFDPVHGGYFEAFNRNWSEIGDVRLSAKDANEKKTMNTHLHIIEAYANLYAVWQNEALLSKIRSLNDLFINHIVNKKTHHLTLFFDEYWNEKPDVISYGHDIEAAWLLLQTSQVLNDPATTAVMKELSVNITRASLEGLNKDGSLSYEYNPATDTTDTDRHWWVQAEALVGLWNAWQLTGDAYFLKTFDQCKIFVMKVIVDHQYGEWYWGVHENHSLMEGEDKVGVWKCPYHNARSCIEMIKRIRSTEE